VVEIYLTQSNKWVSLLPREPAMTDTIADLRAFNRFYTRRIGC